MRSSTCWLRNIATDVGTAVRIRICIRIHIIVVLTLAFFAFIGTIATIVATAGITS